jgi:hypothetical protein
MADSQLTPEQAQKLAEQQKKFNDELIRTQALTEEIFKNDKNIARELKSSVDRANKLNTAFATGGDISKQVSKERLETAAKIQKIDNSIAVKQAILAKTQDVNLAKSLAKQIQSLKTQRSITEQIDAQLRGMEAFVEEEKRALELEKERNTTSGFIKEKYKGLEKSFKEFFSIASIFKIILDGALRFSKISTEIGKNLGYGADNANRVASNMIDVAQSALNVNVTFQNLADAANELSTATGYVAEYSADALETQIMLTKQFGLQAEEAAGIYKLSLLTGKASKTVNQEMVGAFAATRNNLRAGVPFKATMAEAAKVSGVLASNLQNNPKRIVEAVVQAKALGTSLEQAARQGEALLNFESSLENELKAELLTGKQLNLERARAAALTGDQITLTEELVKNVGTIEEFDRMNVLQKKAIAESVGLTADELAKQLQNQKIALENGKSLAEVTADELTKAQERQNVQDKFNQAILKLQDFIGNLVAGPLGTFLEYLSKSLDYITLIGSTLGTIWVTQKAITALEGLKLGYSVASSAAKSGELTKEAALNLMKKEGLATQIGIAAAWAVANPFTALAGLAAAGAVAAGIYALTKKGDDIFSEGGYGKRTLLAPEGAIRLNDNDTVIAGTNLGGGGGMSGGSIDLTPMIAAINEVKIAVNQLMNRPVIINMDSKQVGSSLVQASPKSA